MERKHLLLVEDSDDDALMFARAVKRNEFSVIVDRASDAEEALRLLRSHCPAIIALDIHLPGTGGLELLRELREDRALDRTPIIMMSGTNADVDVALAYALGANSFINKPVEPQEYMDQVAKLLEYWLRCNCTSLPENWSEERERSQEGILSRA